MPDESLRQYLAQQSPWLTLHDLKQEIQELRALVEKERSLPNDTELSRQGLSAPEGAWLELSQRLQALEKRAEGLQLWGNLFTIQVSPQRIFLADARQVERLNEDERIAGLLLALCTLFLGAWVQNIITAPGATTIGILAALFFGGLALFFYWRSRKSWQELHAEGHFSLWPPSGSNGDEGGSS
jgi:hypothetical protein